MVRLTTTIMLWTDFVQCELTLYGIDLSKDSKYDHEDFMLNLKERHNIVELAKTYLITDKLYDVYFASEKHAIEWKMKYG